MSTDDLTRRARVEADRPHNADPALADLVSELADEVDRLRDIATRETAAHETHVARLTTERDAARAALGREHSDAKSQQGPSPAVNPA